MFTFTSTQYIYKMYTFTSTQYIFQIELVLLENITTNKIQYEDERIAENQIFEMWVNPIK